MLPNLVALLLDSPVAGSGVANDWDAVEAALAAHPPKMPVFLAGGLKPDNVGAVARRFRPYAVDVSSGVEDETGLKSDQLVNAFVNAVRDADITRDS